MALTLESLVTSPKVFGLTTATPLQRACMRIGDGLPLGDLLESYSGLLGDLQATCGPGGLARLPLERPRELYVVCGIRNGKSLLFGAGLALRAALTVNLSWLQPWEEPCVSVLSLTRAKARIIMRHLTGPLLAKERLRPLLAREPTGSALWIRRPQDGRVVRIEIAAGVRAGGSLVGDWSAGAIFDEFTRMTGEEEGSVVNFDESRKAVLGRLLPGAQLVGMGSPWAPRGAAFELVKKHWGNPTAKLVVLRPPSRAMNPSYWTDEVIEQLRQSPKGEHIYKTDYLGEFADPESSFFTARELDAVTRSPMKAAPQGGPLELEPRDDVQYFAAMDPALRRNAWTLVITGREYRQDGSFRVIVALARQWMPKRDEPLRPADVLAEIAETCGRYRVSEVMTDGWRSEELAALGTMAKLTVTEYAHTAADDVRLYESLRLRVLGGSIELPDVPALVGDLLAVRKIVRSRTIAMDLPVTSDGRHCDFAPALVTATELAANAPGWLHAMGVLPAGESGLG